MIIQGWICHQGCVIWVRHDVLVDESCAAIMICALAESIRRHLKWGETFSVSYPAEAVMKLLCGAEDKWVRMKRNARRIARFASILRNLYERKRPIGQPVMVEPNTSKEVSILRSWHSDRSSAAIRTIPDMKS